MRINGFYPAKLNWRRTIQLDQDDKVMCKTKYRWSVLAHGIFRLIHSSRQSFRLKLCCSRGAWKWPCSVWISFSPCKSWCLSATGQPWWFVKTAAADKTGSVSILLNLSWMNVMAALTADAWIALIAYLSASLWSRMSLNVLPSPTSVRKEFSCWPGLTLKDSSFARRAVNSWDCYSILLEAKTHFWKCIYDVK